MANMSVLCPLATNTDKKISACCKDLILYSPQSIAYLRVLYDTAHPNKKIDWKNMKAEDAARLLLKEEQKRYKKDTLTAMLGVTQMERLNTACYESYLLEAPMLTSQRIIERAEMISNKVSELITLSSHEYPNVPRRDLVSGTFSGGKFVGGLEYFLLAAKFDVAKDATERALELQNILNIARNVRSDIKAEDIITMDDYDLYVLELEILSELEERNITVNADDFRLYDTVQIIKKLQRILDLWIPLSIRARKIVGHKEGVNPKINIKNKLEITSAEEASLEYGYLEEDAEELPRKAHDDKTKISPIGTLSAEVRALCLSVVMVNSETEENFGSPVTDDLGYVKFVPELEVHENLKEILSGVLTKSEVEGQLESAANSGNEIATSILYSIKNIVDSKQRKDLIGKLFIAFNTALENPTEYNLNKGTKWDPSNNFKRASRRFFSNVVNRLSKLPDGMIHTRLGSKGLFKQSTLEETINSYLNIFAKSPTKVENEGVVSWEYKGIRPFILSLSRVGGNSETIGELRKQLHDLLYNLEINVDNNTLALLLTTANGKLQLNKILNNIDRLIKDGLIPYYKIVANSTQGESPISIRVTSNGNVNKYSPVKTSYGVVQKMNFLDFLNTKTTQGDVVARKAYDDINTLLEEFNPKSRTFDYRYLDRNGKKATYYRTTATSYLYLILDLLNYYVAAQDAEGFMQWLYNEWLSNPLVCEIEDNLGEYKRGLAIKVTKFYNNLILELYETVVPKSKDGTYTGLINQARFRENCENAQSILNNFIIHKGLGSITKKFSDMSEYEHLDMILLDYFGKINNNPKYTNIPIFILGDANAYKNMLGLLYTTTKNKNSIDTAVDYLYNIFLMELKKFDLISLLQDDGINIENLNKHSKEFTELPFLNHTFENGKYAVDLSNPATLTELAVKEKITQYLTDRVDYYLQDFLKKGLLDKDSKTGKYLPKKILRQKLSDTKGVSKAYSEEDIKQVILDMYITIKLNMIDLLNMFDGTTTFYKNVKDLQKRNKQLHASGTFLDLQAEDVYNNRYVLDLRDLSLHCLYFKDPKLDLINNPEYLKLSKLLQKMWKKLGLTEREIRKRTKLFNEITVTDGLGYRTLDSYRDLLIMSHLWTEQLEEVYNKIKALGEEIKALTDEKNPEALKSILSKKLEIANLAVSFKPIKPFTYAFETITLSNGNTVKVPVLHKYAEAVLIPELLSEGSKLKALAEWADETHLISYEDGTEVTRRNADLLISEEGVKVGGFNVTDLTEASGVTDKESLLKRLNGDEVNGISKPWIHKIPYKGYRMLTNTTEHMYESTLYGTLARKLWYNGIKTDDSRSYSSYLNGLKVTLDTKDGVTRATDCSNGSDLIKFYNLLILANLIESFNELKKLLNKDGKGKKILELLINGALANNRLTMQALENFMLTLDEKFILPLFTPTISKDVLGHILSIFKKAVNKQKIAGGSAILVSPTGLNDFRDAGDLKFITDYAGDNVLYGECVIPFDLKIATANGKTFRLDYGTYCNEDGTLKFGRWATEEEVASGMWLSYIQDGKQYIPLIEQHYSGILDLVAKRIPTERNYSMLRLKVKRFTTMAEGPTIKVPAEGTLLAGFDYDIDKLFLMRKEFRAKSFTEELMSKIWDDFYIAHPDIKEALVKALGQQEASNFGKQVLSTILLEGDTPLEMLERLYKYWDKAGLPGTYSYAIESFIAQNLTKYINNGGEHTIFKENMFLEYDNTKSARLNSMVARNNMLFQLFTKRLEDVETLESRFTPGGFFNASDAAKAIRELMYGNFKINDSETESAYTQLLSTVTDDSWKDPEPERDYSELSTLIYYNKQNLIADKEIGVFANHNITHAFLYNFDVCELRNAIAIGEHCDTGLKDLILRNDDSMRGYSELMIAELLAASVDAVKDPVLNYLNINTYTANVAALMARLGYSMLEIGLFLNQPVIKDFVDRCDKKGLNLDVIKLEMESEILKSSEKIDLSKMSTYSQYLNTEALIKGVLHNHTAQQQSVVFLVFSAMLGLASSLSDITTATKMSASNSVGSTLSFFANLVAAIDDINNSFSKKDSNIIISVGDRSYLLSNKLDITSDDYYKSVCDDKAGLEQVFYDTNRGMLKLLEPYFPLANTKGIFGLMVNFFKEASYTDKLSENVINFLFTDLLSYIEANSGNSYFNPLTRVKNLKGDKEMDAATYFREHFVRDYVNFRNSFTPDLWNTLCEYYPILDALSTSESALLLLDEIDNTKTISRKDHNSIFISRANLPVQSALESIESSWADMARLGDTGTLKEDIFLLDEEYPLLLNEDGTFRDESELSEEELQAKRKGDRIAELNTMIEEILPKLARYLVYYSYHTLGNTVQTSSFMYSAPAAVLTRLNDGISNNDLNHIQTLYSILGGAYDNMLGDRKEEFLRFFIRNHSDAYQFVRNVYDKEDLKKLEPLYYSKGKYKETFTISLNTFKDMANGDNLAAYFLRKDPDAKDVIKFYPAVKFGEALYIARPKVNNGSVSFKAPIDSEITYERYDIIGESDKYSRYYDYESSVQQKAYDIDPSEYSYPEVMEEVLNYVYVLKEELENNNVVYDEEFLRNLADNFAQIFTGTHESYNSSNASPFKQLVTLEERMDVKNYIEEILYLLLLGDNILHITEPTAFTRELFKELKTFGKSDVIQQILQAILEQSEDVYTLDENGKITLLCR